METSNKKEILKIVATGVVFLVIVYSLIYLMGVSVGAI